MLIIIWFWTKPVLNLCIWFPNCLLIQENMCTRYHLISVSFDFVVKPLMKGVLQVSVRVWVRRKIQRKDNKVTRHKFQISSSAKHSSALDLGSATLSNRQIVSRAVRLFGSNFPTKQLKNLRKQQLKRERPVSVFLQRHTNNN